MDMVWIRSILGRTAIVLIPVRSVTVAEPPRISIDDTIIFVASLFCLLGDTRLDPRTERAPEEHEDEMSCCSPASSDNLKPSVCEWSVELQLCCEL